MQLGLSCPIYATIPVKRMGQVAMYEAYISDMRQGREMGELTLQDVDQCFQQVTPVQYNQPVHIG